MTEEVQEKVVEKKEEVIAEVSPHEVTAREQGWVSEDEWVESGRDKSDWRPAREFVERGELYKSIHQTKRDLKQTQAALTALQKHHQFVFEKAHQKALSDLKLAKRQAIKEEDFERAELIEEEIDSTKETFEQTKQEQEAALKVASSTSSAIHPDFAIWQSRNSWYAVDSDLREFADATGLVYANKNPGVNPQDVLAHVEKQVRTKFPEKFGAQKTSAPNPTTGVDRQHTRSSIKKADDLQLDEMEYEIMKNLEKQGVMTAAEYKAELRKVKGL